MADDLRRRAFALYAPPFVVRFGYIFDSAGHMVADDFDAEDDAKRTEDRALQIGHVRGWGRIGDMPDGEALQDTVAALMAEALNQLWEQEDACG